MNTIEAYLHASAQKYPENTALLFMGRSIPYRELEDRVDTAAGALCALGVREDDVVCIAMPNVPQAIVMIYAANKVGAVVNMIHPLSSANEMADFVNRVGAKTILVMDRFYDVLKKVRDRTGLRNVIVAGVGQELPPLKRVGYALTGGRPCRYVKREKDILLWRDFLRMGEKNCALPTISDRENKPALILHSGGTTGKVKGVCLSNDSVNASALQMRRESPVGIGDRFLSVMPIFHGNGLVIGIHLILMCGGCCVLIPRFTPDSYAEALLKYRCCYMSGVPALYEKLMAVKVMQKADLSFLKGVFSGADYLSPELERKINGFLADHRAPVRVRQGYGMTEGVVATTLNPIDRQKEGSIGRPLNGVRVKIVEPGTTRELPPGEVGEIVFTSRTNMLCYRNEPEETADTLRLHPDGAYWIHSGDLGTEDGEGFFYFKGRIKRMIVVNGYNVFPNELENIIEGFAPVNRCCILAVPGTQRIKAFIVLNRGYAPTEETKEQILSACRTSIARYALPKEIAFIDEMPRTKIGKVDVNALTAQN